MSESADTNAPPIVWSPLVGLVSFPAPIIAFAIISDYDGVLDTGEFACIWGFALWLAVWIWFDLRRLAAWRKSREAA